MGYVILIIIVLAIVIFLLKSWWFLFITLDGWILYLAGIGIIVTLGIIYKILRKNACQRTEEEELYIKKNREKMKEQLIEDSKTKIDEAKVEKAKLEATIRPLEFRLAERRKKLNAYTFIEDKYKNLDTVNSLIEDLESGKHSSISSALLKKKVNDLLH